MWGVQLTSIEDIETYNKLVQCVCLKVSELIKIFAEDSLGDGVIRKNIEAEVKYSVEYDPEANQPNIYEEVDEV